jgi:hypothetical protein
VNIMLTLSDEQLEQIAQRAAEIAGDSITTSAGDGWLRGAQRIADYIDAPASRVYALTSAKRIPVEHDGSNLLARKSELDAWLRAGGAKRP